MAMNWDETTGGDNEGKADDQAPGSTVPAEVSGSENIFASDSTDSAIPADPFFANATDEPAQNLPAVEPFVSGTTPEDGVYNGGNPDDDYDNSGTDYNEEAEDPPKKKSKLVTYAIVGGALVLLTGVVGGGLMLKNGGSSARQAAVPVEPVATLPVEPTEPKAQIAANVVAVAPSQSFVETETLPPELRAEPYQGFEPGMEPVPVEPAPNVDLQALQELVEGDALTKLTQLAEHQEMLQTRIDSLEVKISALESSNTTILSDVEALKEALKEREEEAEKKVAAKPEPVKKVAAAKPAPKPAAKPKPKPSPSIAAPVAKSPLASARVVGVYPARNPTLAYVVTEKGLTAVRPGEFLLGARVLRLEGLTVVTTGGRVRSQ